MQTKKIIEIVLGTTDYNNVVALFLLAIAGLFISLLMQAVKRDPMSNHTPFKFSWRFLFSDNMLRLFVSILLIAVFLRFSSEIFGIQINAYSALLTGFGFDKLSQILKDKKNLFIK